MPRACWANSWRNAKRQGVVQSAAWAKARCCIYLVPLPFGICFRHMRCQGGRGRDDPVGLGPAKEAGQQFAQADKQGREGSVLNTLNYLRSRMVPPQGFLGQGLTRYLYHFRPCGPERFRPSEVTPVTSVWTCFFNFIMPSENCSSDLLKFDQVGVLYMLRIGCAFKTW